MIVFLLLVIAIGVLLCSEEGKSILNSIFSIVTIAVVSALTFILHAPAKIYKYFKLFFKKIIQKTKENKLVTFYILLLATLALIGFFS